MNKKILIFGRICIAFTFLFSAGESFARPVTILASFDCKDWLEVTATPTSDFRYVIKASREGWAIGYVTGANMYLDTKKNLLEHMSGSTVSAWLDDYCGKKPKSSAVDALDALILRLDKLK